MTTSVIMPHQLPELFHPSQALIERSHRPVYLTTIRDPATFTPVMITGKGVLRLILPKYTIPGRSIKEDKQRRKRLLRKFDRKKPSTKDRENKSRRAERSAVEDTEIIRKNVNQLPGSSAQNGFRGSLHSNEVISSRERSDLSSTPISGPDVECSYFS